MNEDKYSVTIIFLALVLASVGLAGQWPRFRGPNGQGISDAKNIPVRWSQSDYDWRIKLPGITREGNVVVTRAAPECELQAVNSLGEKSDATPAVADEKMYLRAASLLMRVGGSAN
ncbi:MAG: hypothetical protein JSW47_17425 [Phycisphaerales bacterium]|nr:MAG: hypothetical protein JSW47_17425 [Phycisphaerales bacterium]